ncbi:MAG: hypothetical protein ACLFV8_00650 [Alphaproteobacteria bacterium]
MNRMVTCMLAGAMALSLSPVAAVAQEEAPPPAESNPVPLAEVDPADYVDLLAEGKDGNILGIVFDVVLDDAGNPEAVVLELFPEEPPAEDAAGEEPEPLPEEGEEPEGAEGEMEGTEEPVMLGKLVSVSPEGGQLDLGRDLVLLPAVTAEQLQNEPEFIYEEGMKTVAHPDGYPTEAPAEDLEEEEE